jgi:hypothetical protein
MIFWETYNNVYALALKSYVDILPCLNILVRILSRVSLTKDGGSGLDERVYLLLMYTTSNYTLIIALSLFLHFIIHCYTHTRPLLVTQLKHRNYKSLTELHASNITHKYNLLITR